MIGRDRWALLYYLLCLAVTLAALATLAVILTRAVVNRP